MNTLELTPTRYHEVVEKVYRGFFSPAQYEAKPVDREIIALGNNYRLRYNGCELAVTTWGDDGPAVLLMHGWGGARAQMTGFVYPLLSAGFRVVAYDQPAHGESDGKMTNLLAIAPSMERIAEREGGFHAVISHSFGSLISSYALVRRNFPRPARLVYFGAFNRLMDSLPRFQAQAGVPDGVMEGFRGMVYEKFGEGVLDAIVNEELVKHIRIPALLFHDTEDKVTPIDDSRAIAKAWREAQLVETSGLGHRGGLHSKELHAQVMRFLKG